jgi:hypothetical protein
MKNTKKILLLGEIILLLGFCWNALALQKILVVAEQTAYNATSGNLTQYVNDIIQYDHKKAELIVWQVGTGNNWGQCQPLWDTLEQRYFACLSSGDVLEGAVLVGNIPVPLIFDGTTYQELDQVYMDIVDQSSGQLRPYSPLTSPFRTDYGGYFDGTYGTIPSGPAGDGIYDIWVSRINASYLNGGIRQGANFYDEYTVYNNYLQRVHARMTSPATVPSRGFVMGGPQDRDPVSSVLTQYMDSLKLPWLTQFTGGDNSPFNWMSQLLAGPRGCITYGAFDGTLFPGGRSSRYCKYTHLPVYIPGASSTHDTTLSLSDSLGWEWAGLYGHSCPAYTDFFSNGNDGYLNNGRFSFGTLGPYFGSPNYQTTGDYNNEHLWYKDSTINPDPYNNTLQWKQKKAQWRWKVSHQPAGTNYNVYVYYVADPSNVNYIEYWLYQMSVFGGTSQHIMTASGASRLEFAPGATCSPQTCDPNGLNPGTGTGCCQPPNNDYSTGQRSHYDHGLADPNWEKIFTNVSGLIPDSIVQVQVPAVYSSRPWCPTITSITGNYIIDAIRFISCNADGTPNYAKDTIIDDDASISGYPNQDNYASELFSMSGCYTTDGEYRGYEDMGNEPGGGGKSKSLFFITNACDINNWHWTTPQALDDPNYSGYAFIKNIGNLYALGHNGLICFGTATDDYEGQYKGAYTIPLKNGKDCGEGFVAMQNYGGYYGNFTGPYYALLGAGSLHIQPYVQYGSYTEPPRTISDNESTSKDAPVLVQNVNVAGTGNWKVTSSHDGNSPFGTNSTIVIRPECDFAPTGADSVHLVVTP